MSFERLIGVIAININDGVTEWVVVGGLEKNSCLFDRRAD
jgi:hypothetical protein